MCVSSDFGRLPRVCAVVVTHNRRELLRCCLAALLEQTHPLDQILVVDNASSDGTPEMLRIEFQEVETIRLASNLGGAGGFHYGMKWAYDRGFDWIWIMDDDVRATASALIRLLTAAIDNPLVIPAPLRLHLDGTLAEGASLVYDLDSLICLPGRHQQSILAAYSQASLMPQQQEVQGLSFEGPLIPRSAIQKAGLPCKDFFVYGDDTEYSLRLTRAGYRLCLIGSSVLYRMLPLNSGNNLPPAWKARYIIRNTLWINRMHGADWRIRRLRTLLWVVCYFLSNLLKLNWIRDPRRWVESMRGLAEAVVAVPHRSYEV